MLPLSLLRQKFRKAKGLVAVDEVVPFAELAGVRPGEEREPLGPTREAKLELVMKGGLEARRSAGAL